MPRMEGWEDELRRVAIGPTAEGWRRWSRDRSEMLTHLALLGYVDIYMHTVRARLVVIPTDKARQWAEADARRNLVHLYGPNGVTPPPPIKND